MPKLNEEKIIDQPYVRGIRATGGIAIGGNGGGGGGGGGGDVPNPHALDSSYHSGTLAWDSVSKANSDLSDLALRPHSALTGIGADDHHDQAHDVVGSDHTVVGSAFDLVGLLADDTLGLLTPSSDPGTAAAILRTDSAGGLTLAGTLRLNSDPQLYANLDFAGGDRFITTGSGGDLTISIGSSAALILSDDDTFRTASFADGIPITGFSFFPAASQINRQLTINSIKSDELHTRLFVADTMRIDIGEEYWGKSMGIVYSDFITPAIGATVAAIFEDSPLMPAEIFANGDWLLIRYLNNAIGFGFGSVWGQVSAYAGLGTDAAGRSRQQWTFTMRAGPVGQRIKAGNIAVDLGTSGQGFVHLSALDDAQGPWIRIGEWTGSTPYAAPGEGIGVTGTQIGRLDGVADDALNPAGYGLYSDNAYLRGMLRTAETIMDDDGVSFSIPVLDSDYDWEADRSRVAWWASLDDRSEEPYSYVTSYRLERTDPPLPTNNELVINVNAGGFADLAALRLQAHGASAAEIVLQSDGALYFYGLSRFNNHALPLGDLIYDLGAASFRWRAIYVDQLNAGTISGDTMSGSEWEFGGNMIIDAISSSDTTVTVTNQGTGRADLSVDRNIIVGGTVDGVNISDHAASALHHNPVTVLANSGLTLTGATGQQILIDLANPGSGLELVAGGLKVAAALAGVGLSYDAGTGTITVASTLAGAGLMMTLGIMRVVQGAGLLVTEDNVTLDPTIAGDGLSINPTTKVMAVSPGAGLEIAGDTVAISLATTSGLNTTSGLAVGAGAGIDVLANTVAIDLGTNSGLTFSGGLVVNPTIAGNGMSMTSGILNVGNVDGSITVGPNNLTVNLLHDFTWAGVHTFNSNDIQANVNLDFVGARSITSSASNNLTIAPGGDLVLDPTGTDVLPGGSALIDLGDYNRKWRTLFAAELYVETLVASNVMATIGGRIMVAPTTKLVADVSTGAGSIDVEHNGVLGAGDYLVLQTAPGGVAQFEVMRVVTGGGAVTGGYRYTVLRDQDGTGANSWLTGDAVVNAGGAVGEGWIDLTSVTTAMNHFGPTVTIYRAHGDDDVGGGGACRDDGQPRQLCRLRHRIRLCDGQRSAARSEHGLLWRHG